MTPEGCNIGLLRLMQMCWDSYPAARPDFEQVLQILPTIAEEQLPEPIATQSSGPGPANPALGGKDQKPGFFARMRRRVRRGPFGQQSRVSRRADGLPSAARGRLSEGI